jgi:hypothetical protein
VLHVLKCPSEAPTRVWETTLGDLQTWLDKCGTDPFITDSLITGLRTWRQAPDGSVDAGMNYLLSAQAQIGWNSVLEGCFSTYWTHMQHQFFQRQNSTRSGNRWMTQLIKRIWKIPWDLWQHRNHQEHLQDQERLVGQLRAEVHAQVAQGYDNVPELELMFGPLEIDQVLSCRDVPYVRVWLRNVRAGRRRDLLRRGSRGEMAQMRAVMRAFLQ